MEQNDKRYRQREVASSWNHFLNQRDGPTFHCSFELFLVLTQLQRGNDLVISTSSIITIFFTQAIFIQYQMTNGQRQNKTEKK